MQASEAGNPKLLAHYEGLVRKTAARYVGVVEEDYEDLCSVFRIKVWRALLSFDPAKSRLPRDRYVFSCIRNQAKDLVRKKRRNELFIEDVAPMVNGNGEVRDAFEMRYLQESEEDAFDEVLTSPPLIPSTLDARERSILIFLYNGYEQAEMAARLSITKREVAASVKTIKEKMADWRPTRDRPTAVRERAAA